MLTKISEQRFFDEKMAAKIIKQILSAVEFFHKNKIVHRQLYITYNYRDIKPENIMFEDSSLDSALKIIDFGRSKLVQPKERMTDKAGSVFAYNELL